MKERVVRGMVSSQELVLTPNPVLEMMQHTPDHHLSSFSKKHSPRPTPTNDEEEEKEGTDPEQWLAHAAYTATRLSSLNRQRTNPLDLQRNVVPARSWTPHVWEWESERALSSPLPSFSSSGGTRVYRRDLIASAVTTVASEPSSSRIAQVEEPQTLPTTRISSARPTSSVSTKKEEQVQAKSPPSVADTSGEKKVHEFVRHLIQRYCPLRADIRNDTVLSHSLIKCMGDALERHRLVPREKKESTDTPASFDVDSLASNLHHLLLGVDDAHRSLSDSISRHCQFQLDITEFIKSCGHHVAPLSIHSTPPHREWFHIHYGTRIIAFPPTTLTLTSSLSKWCIILFSSLSFILFIYCIYYL